MSLNKMHVSHESERTAEKLKILTVFMNTTTSIAENFVQ